MRKIKEILKLKWFNKLSNRQIAQNCNVSPSTVSDLLQRATHANLSWPTVQEFTDKDLEALLYVEIGTRKPDYLIPDWKKIHKELAHPNVTLRLLWWEYKEEHPNGFQYSQFCHHYRKWAMHLDVVMRQTHKAGEKVFVDWAGQTVPIYNRYTGATEDAYLFVAVLGASNYTFAYLFPSMVLVNWVLGHCLAFEFFEGVPTVIVPDNLKAGVTKAMYYDPDLNPTYADLARHYGAVVLPTRVRKPNDKAKVEHGVLHSERWILAALRNRKFFSVDEANLAIAEKLENLNNKPFQKMDGCRTSWFLEIDKPALGQLPETRYEFRQWKKVTVPMDYHVGFDKKFYSVPYKLCGKTVEILATQTTIEVYHKGQRVAIHKRSNGSEPHLTDPMHMPASHRAYANRNPEDMLLRASEVGPQAEQWVKGVFEACAHPEQGYRMVLGMFQMLKTHPPEQINSACQRANNYGAFTYRSLKSILDKGLYNLAPVLPDQPTLPEHENVRGAEYYATVGGDS